MKILDVSRCLLVGRGIDETTRDRYGDITLDTGVHRVYKDLRVKWGDGTGSPRWRSKAGAYWFYIDSKSRPWTENVEVSCSLIGGTATFISTTGGPLVRESVGNVDSDGHAWLGTTFDLIHGLGGEGSSSLYGVILNGGKVKGVYEFIRSAGCRYEIDHLVEVRWGEWLMHDLSELKVYEKGTLSESFVGAMNQCDDLGQCVELMNFGLKKEFNCPPAIQAKIKHLARRRMREIQGLKVEPQTEVLDIDNKAEFLGVMELLAAGKIQRKTLAVPAGLNGAELDKLKTYAKASTSLESLTVSEGDYPAVAVGYGGAGVAAGSGAAGGAGAGAGAGAAAGVSQALRSRVAASSRPAGLQAELDAILAGPRVPLIGQAAEAGDVPGLIRAYQIENMDAVDSQGHTPYMLAVKANQLKAARWLAKQKPAPDVSLKSEAGDTALHIAMRHGHLDFLERILEVGCDLGVAPLIEAQNTQGETPLWMACRYGHRACIQALLKHGAKWRTNSQGQTALHAAMLNKKIRVVKDIIGVHDVNAQDQDGNTVLHYAVLHGGDQANHLVYALLQIEGAGWNIELRNRAGKRAMDLSRSASIQTHFRDYEDEMKELAGGSTSAMAVQLGGVRATSAAALAAAAAAVPPAPPVSSGTPPVDAASPAHA